MNEWLCYEAGADAYADAGEDDPAWRQRHRDRFVHLLHGSTIADLGCGPGFDLAAFAARGLKTVGIDGSAAMLQIAARNSPSSILAAQDLRHPLPAQVDGIWSMFALLHLPETDLAGCFTTWHRSMTRDGPLMLGLTESGVMELREVPGWLGQSTPAVFYYHRAERVRELLSSSGFRIIDAIHDTPSRYRGGVYDELQLSAYVIAACAQ